MPLEPDLVDYALDQYRALGKGWRAMDYIDRCLIIWEREYGRKTRELVEALIRKGVIKDK